MASGRDKIKVVVAVTSDDVPVLLDIPDFDKDLIDSIFIEDGPFTNIGLIPHLMGVYELECEYYWDDGCNAFFERTDSEIEFKIVKVNELYLI